MTNEEESKTLRMLKNGILKAEKELNRTVEELQKLSKKSMNSLDGAKPVARNIMKLADAVAKDIESSVPVITNDLISIEKKIVSRTKQTFGKKKE